MVYLVDNIWIERFGMKGVYINKNNPSFNWLTGLDLPFVECKAIISNKKKIWKEKIKVSNNAWAKEQCMEVITFFNETLKEGENPRRLVEIIEEDAEAAIYEDGVGFTGWLTDKGEFLACDFGEHGIFVQSFFDHPVTHQDIDRFIKESKYIALYDGSVEDTSSYVKAAGDMTKEQINWFVKFSDKLELAQQLKVSSLFSNKGLNFLYVS